MISVITATYNRAYSIINLYKSLLLQTNKKFEWVVIDDGSTDNTKETIKRIVDEKKLLLIIYIKLIAENILL